jgi:cyclopropane fatty-acyl-phospholipid synthase-like methyltransferase
MTLSPNRVRRIYDRIGRFQETQGFYEHAALDALVGHRDFGAAHHLVEIGCGTGTFARRLLDQHLPPHATYLGIELSPKMADIARDRLAPHAARAEVIVADAAVAWPVAANGADRVVANYVFDLLDPEATSALLDHISAALRAEGLLCAVSLTSVPNGAAHVTATVWTALWRWRPALTGGCRPISLGDTLDHLGWSFRHRDVVTAWTLSSEVVIAQPAATPAAG